MLQPYIVSTWTGRSPTDAPAELRRPLLNADEPGETTYLVVFDSGGNWKRTISGGTMRQGRPGAAVDAVREPLAKLAAEWKLPAAPRLRDVRLPDVAAPKAVRSSPAGVRIFVKLPNHEQTSYRVPIVVPVPLDEKHWNPLTYPTTARDVNASDLSAILTDLYPPAMKEMVGPRIRNGEVSGRLRLSPSGSDGSHRYAVLSGDVQFVLAGRTNVSHGGKIRAVVKYALSGDDVRSFHAVYDGTYPEHDPRRNRTTNHAVSAVLESRP